MDEATTCAREVRNAALMRPGEDKQALRFSGLCFNPISIFLRWPVFDFGAAVAEINLVERIVLVLAQSARILVCSRAGRAADTDDRAGTGRPSDFTSGHQGDSLQARWGLKSP